jgi:hypothetical protein
MPLQHGRMAVGLVSESKSAKLVSELSSPRQLCRVVAESQDREGNRIMIGSK